MLIIKKRRFELRRFMRKGRGKRFYKQRSFLAKEYGLSRGEE